MKMHLHLCCAFAIAVGAFAQTPGPAAAPADRPWMNRALPPEQRAELLVRQMTLDEKILEIHMLNVREHPREVAGIQRLGIPVFKITNGPAGAGPGDSRSPQPATALPAALAVAASWDPRLADLFGQIAGQEVAARGEHLIEGPGLNIARVARNGRNFEYFGEDPYLSGRMGVAETRALQQQGIIAEPKHYAANNQETDRKKINEIIDERTLREIYLPAFEVTVKEADPGAIMAAYPSVNGAFCSENAHLLQDILRGEWGFQGFVQSDYTGTNSTTRAAAAGLDLSMRADYYGDNMKAAVQRGEVPEATIDAMVRRRFTQMFRFGMFDAPLAPKPIPAEKDGLVARAIALQCAVLLKNAGGQLPLDAHAIRTIALIGPYASAAHTGGRGSSMVHPIYTVSPIDGIKRHVGYNVTVTLNDGSDLGAATKAAKAAEVALVMVGNRDAEGKDRASLSLEEGQDDLIAAVAAANPHTVVVLKTGGPVLMPWLDQVSAVLEAWYPGEEDGNVVADLLFGAVNPSGKLPMTFPKTEKEVPASTPEQYPGVNGNATYSEKLLVGYRWYDAKKVEPLFPFGFGLSYTTFTFANLEVSPFAADRRMTASVDIANTGARPGADVIQVYVSAPAAVGEPPQQLKGFAKVMLKPHETRRVTVTLDPRAFSIWDDAAKRWTVVAGEHRILVGDSSRNLPLQASVTISAAP